MLPKNFSRLEQIYWLEEPLGTLQVLSISMTSGVGVGSWDTYLEDPTYHEDRMMWVPLPLSDQQPAIAFSDSVTSP